MVMVLHGTSDVRWKAAAGLGIDDEGFDASVLTLWLRGCAPVSDL